MMQDFSVPRLDSPQDLSEFIQNSGKQIIEEVQRVAKRAAEIEVALLDFELLYSVAIPEKEKKKNEEWFRKHREKMWTEALKKTNGDEEKALLIYGDV